MEPFQESGVFWLPDEEATQRPGQLSFNHDRAGVTLALFSPFEHPFVFMSMVQTHPGYPLIFGHLQSGQLVTLTSAVVTNAKMSFDGTLTVRAELKLQYLFRGAHLGDGEQTNFRGLRIKFDHFDSWAFQAGPLASEVGEDGEVIFTTFDIPDISCAAFGGTLTISYLASQEVGDLKSTFERSSLIEFDADEEAVVKDLTQTVTRPLQYLLTFLCGVAVFPTEFAVRIEGMGSQVGTTFVPTWIEVAYSGWHPPTDVKTATLRLPLRSIQDRIEVLMNAWDTLYKRQERAIVRLFAITLGLDLYLDTRFLFAVQAVELYHRQKWQEGVLPKADHKRRVKSITDLVEDKTMKTWLKTELAYSNEPTLRERLSKMVDFAGTETSEFLRSDFAKVSADTRNYLTHYDPRGKDKASDDEDLWVLSTEVMALLEFCLMRDLGFDGPTSFDHCAPTSTFQSLLQRQGKMSPVHISTTSAEPTDSDESTEDGDQSGGDAPSH